MIEARSINPEILRQVRQLGSGLGPQGVQITTPLAYSKIEDLDPETQVSVRKAIEWVRLDREGLHTGTIRNDFSDNQVYKAISEANITALDDDKLEEQIDIFSYVVQSGRMESFSILGRNGDQTTTSIYEYLTWLTTRREEMKDDGTYSPKLMRPE